MEHLDSLLRKHPHLRHVDYQRLIQRAKLDPAGTWEELVEASVPIVYTTALRLAADPRAAERATTQVFQAIEIHDHKVLRDYVGYGKWPSILVRMTQAALADQRPEREAPRTDVSVPVDDPDGPIPVLDSSHRGLLEQEGDRFYEAMRRVIHVLHRRDRLMLGMRYEQGLHLRELDIIFRLGTPQRVASLLDRLVGSLQPLSAVAEAWSLSGEQKHALLRVVVHRLYQAGSMETDEDKGMAEAMQQR